MKIGTHDSATGEQGKWWCFPFLPFAKTQSKTLIEQYKAGCKLFDLRVKEYKGQWHFAHGPWISKYPAVDYIRNLGNQVILDNSNIYASITYEGKNYNEQELLHFYKRLQEEFPEITFIYLAVKFGKTSKGVKCKYDFLDRNKNVGLIVKQEFKQLDGRSWHTYLPIPWLWKKLYYNNPTFDNEIFKYVDFL